MTVEERLREKSNTLSDFWLTTDYDEADADYIKLSDAIEITKDLFTKEQVEEIRKEAYNKGLSDAIGKIIDIEDSRLLNIAKHNIEQLKEQHNG